MRKILIIFIFVILTNNLFSQVVKLKNAVSDKYVVAPMGSFLVERTVYVDYVIYSFKDTRYQIITSIESFTLNRDDDDSLCNILLSTKNNDGDRYKIKTLDDGELYISFKKSLGVHNCR